VGRDLRVRLVWMMIKNEIERDSSLSDYEIYEDMSKVHDLICPFCRARILIREKVYHEMHDDGTYNFHYEYVPSEMCEHLYLTGFYYSNNYDNYTDYLEDLRDQFKDLKQYHHDYDEIYSNPIFDDLFQSFEYFCETYCETQCVEFAEGEQFGKFVDDVSIIVDELNDMYDAMKFLFEILHLDE
jgi:hypothetical protein